VTDTVNVDTLVERLRTHITTDGLVVPSDEALATLDDLAARARDARQFCKEADADAKAAEADRDLLRQEARIRDVDRDRLARRVAELEQVCEKAIRERRSLESKEDDWHSAYERSERRVAALERDQGYYVDELSEARRRVAELEAALRDGATVAAQYMDTERGDLDGWIDRARALAGDGGDDAAIVKTIRERDAADTGERITLGDLVADIEAAREEADGDGGGAAADTTEDADASH